MLYPIIVTEDKAVNIKEKSLDLWNLYPSDGYNQQMKYGRYKNILSDYTVVHKK